MSEIILNDVSVSIPVYDTSKFSLKNKIANVITGGGILKRDTSGVVVVNSLSNVNIKFVDGDRVALVGHNGAGKTTLLRLINSVYIPTSGSIKVFGSVSSFIDILVGIDPESSGRNNAILRCMLLGHTKRSAVSLVNSIIDFSGLGEYIDMPVRTYSSGMAMRLAFSIVSELKSDIILMDEWLSVGDADFRGKAELKLNDMVDNSKILLIATHDPNIIRNICNRVIVLEKGCVVSDVDINTFFESKYALHF